MCVFIMSDNTGGQLEDFSAPNSPKIMSNAVEPLHFFPGKDIIFCIVFVWLLVNSRKIDMHTYYVCFHNVG